MAAHDRLGLEAIKSLHSQLDDDANGNVDLSESDDVRRLTIVIFISIFSLLEMSSVIVETQKKLIIKMILCNL